MELFIHTANMHYLWAVVEASWTTTTTSYGSLSLGEDLLRFICLSFLLFF